MAALNGKAFHDDKVEVKFNPCNRLLCVGNVPANMDNVAFQTLVQSYGPVERCFLMENDAGKCETFIAFCRGVNRLSIIRKTDYRLWTDVVDNRKLL